MQIPGGPSLVTSHNIVIVNDEDIKDARCDIDAKQDVEEVPSPLLDSVELARQHADHSILMEHEMELDAHHQQEEVPAFDHMLSLSFANSPDGDVPDDRHSLSSEMKLVPPLKQQSSVSHIDHDEKEEKEEEENVSYQDVFSLMSAPQRSIPRDHARDISISHASSIDSVEAPRSAPPALPSVAAPSYPPSQSRKHVVKLHSQRVNQSVPLISAASPTSSGKYPSRSVASASQSRLSSPSHHIHSPSHADNYASRQQQRLAKMEAKYEGEDYIADLMSHSDDDDDDEGKVVQIAKMSIAAGPSPPQQIGVDMGFAQLDQPMRIPRQHDMHWWALILMILQVIIYAADVIMNGILIYYYWQHGFWPSAICLLAVRGIASFMSIIFDYVNRGTCAFLPLHLLQARILLESSYYLTEWLHHRYRKWTHSEFRAAYAFENLIVSMPSLMIQTYVLILQSSGPSTPSEIWASSFEPQSTTAALISSTPTLIQILSMCITAIAASIDLYHYYRYISVPQWIYITMMCKGIYTTFVRTFVMALLIHAFGVYFLFFWLGLSYIAGWCLYAYALRLADRRARDNPLSSRWCHMIVGHQVAQTMMFVSLPFATSHSVEDWWVGYLLSDIKIHIDTGLLIALVTWRTDKDATVWICFIITMMMMIINMYVLVIMHRVVQPYIMKRALFSTTLIVKLYATMCVHLKSCLFGIAKEDEFNQRLPHHKVRLASRPSNPQSPSRPSNPHSPSLAMRKVQERARSVIHAGRDLISLAQGNSPRFADDPIMVQPEDIGLNVPREVG